MIKKILQHYYPDWDPPDDNREWNLALCPDHEESKPSFVVSYTNGACVCYACGFKGDSISIIRQKEEGITFPDAVQRAEEISGESHKAIPSKSKKHTRRRVFTQPWD